MSPLSITFLRRVAAAALAFVLSAGAAMGHDGATGVVALRMEAMKRMGQHMKALGNMLSGKTTFDWGTAKRHAEILHEHGELVMGMFPPGSNGHHTEAAPAVWTERAEFDKRMRQFDAAVEDLVAVAVGDRMQLREKFKAVGFECSGCHDNFRRKK